MTKKLTTILSVTALMVATVALFIAWQNKGPRIAEIPAPSAREVDYTATTTPVVESLEDGL